MLKLIYGKSGSGKTLNLYNDIKENLFHEKIFLIVPEQSNLSAERNLFKVLKNETLLNVEVLTLSRMALRILDEIYYVNNSLLTKAGKAMIIYNILKEEQNNLKFLGNSDKNVDILINLITELKKHNITVEKLESLNLPDVYSTLKINDINLILKKYNEKIQNSFVDENDILNIVADNFEKSKIFENSLIYIDDFIGFTPQEYRIFEELLKKAGKITVAISTDGLENVDKEQDVFYFNKVFANKLIEIAKRNNSKIEYKKCEKNYRLKNEELKFLENAFSNQKTFNQYTKNTENIKLFLANNSYSELEFIANEIFKLVKNNNYKYNEIAIISDNIDDYSSEAKTIFNKYNIPIFIDEKKDLNQNLLIKYVLSILEIFAQDWSFDSVFNYLKLNMLDIDTQELYKLENYCRKWGIRNYKWFRKFNYEPENENQENLEKLKEKVITPLVNLKEELSKNKTAEEITKCIYKFLIENNIDKILDKKIKQINDIELNNEYNTSYKILIDILNEIVLIFGNQKMTFDTYKNLLQIGFTESELGKIPATQDEVILGDIRRSRNNNIKVCFIVGINDGSFPTNNKFEGYLDDQDRELLKEQGIELAKTSMETLYESNFEIYNILSLPSEKLYLSYCSSDKEGKSIRPSILIKKIKRIFSKLYEESDIISKQYFITNKIATFDDSVNVYKKMLDGEKVSDEWKTAINYYSRYEKNKFNGVLQGLNYTNKAEDISNRNIERLYGNVLKTSVSRLEQYKMCPFAFHLKYGLKLKEKEELKLQSLNTGTFMHEVIDEFFNKISQDGLNIKEIDDETLRKIVQNIIDELFSMSKYYIFSSTAKFRTLTRKLKKVIFESLSYIIYSLKNSKFEVFAHELEFGGTNGKYKPIIIELDNGKKVEIIGKIDRVDVGKLNDKSYVRIIDYKSSIKSLDMKQVEAGLQIQLITYLDAVSKQEDFVPSAVLYSGLIESIVSKKRNLTDDEIAMEIRKNFRMDGVVLADVNVIKMMDTKLSTGSSDIIPVTLKQDGEISAKGSHTIKEEEFNELQNKVNTVIKEISKEILSGKIQINPYSYNGRTGCDYCDYKSICMFNPNIKENTYNYI